MKNVKFIAVIAMLFGASYSLHAQTIKETFKVYGNCGMCQKTIESAAKSAGAASAKWNKDSKMITVSYDVKKTTNDSIQKKIASAGYDTERFTANDKSYKNLHECCQYERKTKINQQH